MPGIVRGIAAIAFVAMFVAACQSSVNSQLPVILTFRDTFCPDPKALAPTGPADHDVLMRLLPDAIASVLNSKSEHQPFTIERLQLAKNEGLHGKLVAARCGEQVAQRTWIAFVGLPNPDHSNDMGARFFITKERNRWELWLVL